MPDLGDLRARVESALQESMDRCARCKTCDVQVDAVMSVLSAALEGAATEWAIAYTHRPAVPGLQPRRRVQPYPDEDMAREAVADLRKMAPGDEPALMRREISPWREVPDA